MDIMQHLRPFIICNTGVVLLGFTAVLSQLIDWPTLVIVAARSIIAMGSIGLFLLFTKHPLLISSIHRQRAMLTGLFLAIHWFTYFKAVELSGVAIGLSALFTFPIITVLIEPLWHKIPYVKHNLLAALFCFFGVGILLNASFSSPDIRSGIGVGIISAIAYTIRNLMSKPLLTNVSSTQLMFTQVTTASFFYVMLLYFTRISPSDLSFSTSNIIYVVLLGTLFTGAAHTMFMHGFSAFSASFVSILAAVQPLYGTLLGIWILGEIPTMSTWVGGGFILMAIIYATRKKSC